MYSAIDVARYIIWYCKRRRYSISNLKLQKILYFVQANFLVSIGTPCFEEEIEAWDFGLPFNKIMFQFLISDKWGIGWKVPLRSLLLIVVLCLASAAIAIRRPIKQISSMAIVDAVKDS